jgi:hypothetical protein
VCDRYIHVIYKISGCNSTSFGVVLSDMLHVVLKGKLNLHKMDVSLEITGNNNARNNYSLL